MAANNTEKKKILFVANVAKEHINKFHIPTIKVFRKNGWIVDVACSVDEEVPEYDHLFDMCWKRNPFSLKTIKGIIDLKKIIIENQYDIIYCHTPVGGLVGRLAAKSLRKKGVKVVYCAHGLHFFKGAPLINWILFYPIEKTLAYYTDVFITINKEDYQRVCNKFNPKMKVELIPGIGVNFSRLKVVNPTLVREKYRAELQIPKKSTVLIYVAELLPNKNQTMLVDVLEILIKQGEDVYLVLPGPDHESGALQRYVDQKGLTDRVKILGWRSDVGELLHMADVCVASSIREGFGVNLVEAMYCGLPVVATKNRGHEMIIEDGTNGYLVTINDTDSMSKRILDAKLYKSDFRRINIANIPAYDATAVAERLFDIIV